MYKYNFPLYNFAFRFFELLRCKLQFCAHSHKLNYHTLYEVIYWCLKHSLSIVTCPCLIYLTNVCILSVNKSFILDEKIIVEQYISEILFIYSFFKSFWWRYNVYLTCVITLSPMWWSLRPHHDSIVVSKSIVRQRCLTSCIESLLNNGGLAACSIDVECQRWCKYVWMKKLSNERILLIYQVWVKFSH